MCRATRRHGGVLHAGIIDQLEPRTHVGIATGGRCGGSPPAQGRAGTARPPQRQWPVVGGQWSVASGQELQGPCMTRSLPEVKECLPHFGLHPESRRRNEVAYQRRPPVRSLAEASGCHLGDRAHRLPLALPDMLDTSNKCGRHGAQAHLKNPQSAACRADGGNAGRDKSRASKLTPRRRAKPNSRSCHWDGIRPVLAQCCTVL